MIFRERGKELLCLGIGKEADCASKVCRLFAPWLKELDLKRSSFLGSRVLLQGGLVSASIDVDL